VTGFTSAHILFSVNLAINLTVL